MATKNDSRQILTTILVMVVSLCIVLVLVHQTGQVLGVLTPEATPTRIPVYSTGGGSGIEVPMEDVVPTFTPTPMDTSHQE